MNDGRKIYTVSELNREIKSILEDSYPDIWLEGEISNYKTYPSGHSYFTLKDAESQIAAVLFQNVASTLRFQLEDGLKVCVRAKVSTYPKRGDYQLIIFFAEPSGKGALQLAFEQLKKKLEAEGIFDASRKKPIPFLPQRIGIITSPSGAAIRDIITIINRRFASVELLLYPVRVQGEEAPEDIARAIGYLNTHHRELDVLLVGRGGGSLEDLWAFNEEQVARAIAGSRIPIISCVGHETDYTIADFVADLRAPTPSAAAELVVQNKEDLMRTVRRLFQSLVSALNYRIDIYSEQLARLQHSTALTKPQELFAAKLQEIDELLHGLVRGMNTHIRNAEISFQSLVDKMQLLSPLAILGRGYAVCRTYPEKLILRSP